MVNGWRYLLVSLLFSSMGFGADFIDQSRVFELTYSIEIPKPERKFHRLKVWVPVPTQNSEQLVLEQSVQTKAKYKINRELQYGNQMIYFEIDSHATFPFQFEAKYKVLRKVAQSHPASSEGFWDFQRYLSAYRLGPLDGVVKKKSDDVCRGIQTNSKKIDHIYRHVVETMSYDKSGQGWGKGDAIWACTNRRGNCTDFHSLFVAMSRSQKIPARFEIGLPVPETGRGEIGGYHCWARVFDPLRQWIPLDASESKKAGEPMKYFGSLPANRIHFTTGRDLILSPKQSGEPLNYFIYPYAELDNHSLKSLKSRFYVTTVQQP